MRVTYPAFLAKRPDVAVRLRKPVVDHLSVLREKRRYLDANTRKRGYQFAWCPDRLADVQKQLFVLLRLEERVLCAVDVNEVQVWAELTKVG